MTLPPKDPVIVFRESLEFKGVFGKFLSYKFKILPLPLAGNFTVKLFSIEEIVDLFIDDHEIILKSLKKNKKKLILASEIFFDTYNNNSRIFFMGAGTSGRLGVIEAAELPPTFGTNKNSIIGLIAGGNKALVTAIEGAEDKKLLGIENLKKKAIQILKKFIKIFKRLSRITK